MFNAHNLGNNLKYLHREIEVAQPTIILKTALLSFWRQLVMTRLLTKFVNLLIAVSPQEFQLAFSGLKPWRSPDKGYLSTNYKRE